MSQIFLLLKSASKLDVKFVTAECLLWLHLHRRCKSRKGSRELRAVSLRVFSKGMRCCPEMWLAPHASIPSLSVLSKCCSLNKCPSAARLIKTWAAVWDATWRPLEPSRGVTKKFNLGSYALRGDIMILICSTPHHFLMSSFLRPSLQHYRWTPHRSFKKQWLTDHGLKQTKLSTKILPLYNSLREMTSTVTVIHPPAPDLLLPLTQGRPGPYGFWGLSLGGWINYILL